MSLTTRIISSQAELISLQPAWENLLAQSSTGSFFSTPTFQLSWLGTMTTNAQLSVITVWKENQLVGLAPFLICRKQQASMLINIGSVEVTDYFDVLVASAIEEAVYQSICSALAGLDVKNILLQGIPETSPTRSQFKKNFSSIDETQQTVSPKLILPQTWEAYLQLLERKQRHELRRKWRKVEALSHEFEVLEEVDAVQTALADFFNLHQRSSAEKASFWTDQTKNFFTTLVSEAARAGLVKLFFLKIEEDRVATMLVFDYQDTYLLYNSGFDPNRYRQVSSGTVLTAYTIKHAIEQGRKNYDFLRGSEKYKFHLGGKPMPIFDLNISISGDMAPATKDSIAQCT